MPRVGLETTISVFERAKKIHALDSAATVIGLSTILLSTNEDKARKVVGRTGSLAHSTVHLGTTQIQNKRTQTSIPRVGFEPTTPVFEREKTLHA